MSPWGYPNIGYPDQRCPAPRVPLAEVRPDNITIRHDIFINSTPANSHQNPPSRRASCTSNTEIQQEAAEGSDGSPDQQENHVPVITHEELADFETVKRVLNVLGEGRMDVAGFLDTLCWGNQPAITDPSTRSARTSLTHSDWLVGIVSHWLCPPQTSQGG